MGGRNREWTKGRPGRRNRFQGCRVFAEDTQGRNAPLVPARSNPGLQAESRWDSGTVGISAEESGGISFRRDECGTDGNPKIEDRKPENLRRLPAKRGGATAICLMQNRWCFCRGRGYLAVECTPQIEVRHHPHPARGHL